MATVVPAPSPAPAPTAFSRLLEAVRSKDVELAKRWLPKIRLDDAAAWIEAYRAAGESGFDAASLGVPPSSTWKALAAVMLQQGDEPLRGVWKRILLPARLESLKKAEPVRSRPWQTLPALEHEILFLDESLRVAAPAELKAIAAALKSKPSKRFDFREQLTERIAHWTDLRRTALVMRTLGAKVVRHPGYDWWCKLLGSAEACDVARCLFPFWWKHFAPHLLLAAVEKNLPEVSRSLAAECNAGAVLAALERATASRALEAYRAIRTGQASSVLLRRLVWSEDRASLEWALAAEGGRVDGPEFVSDGTGTTLLHEASAPTAEIAEMLIGARCDPSFVDGRGETALDAAVGRREKAKEALSAAAETDESNRGELKRRLDEAERLVGALAGAEREKKRAKKGE